MMGDDILQLVKFVFLTAGCGCEVGPGVSNQKPQGLEPAA